MERINIVIVMLILLNLIPWCFSSLDEEKENPDVLQGKIVSMEKEFQDFEELASWTSGAQSALDPPPEEDVTTFINRFQGLAKAWRINLQEMAQTGDNPVLISITGVGDYKALTNLINEMARSQAVIPKKITLATQDNGLLHVHMDLSVRFGPWQGLPARGRNDPIPEPQPPPNLGAVDLFGRKIVAPLPVSAEPIVQYLGFSSGERKPSAIIEENNKALIVEPGDKTPGGLLVGRMTPESLELTLDGKTWQVPIKPNN